MGRVEILTGPERRRVWSDDQKLAILREVAGSGVGVAAIARRHDLCPQQIYAWRKQFCEPAPALEGAVSLLPVTVVEADMNIGDAPKGEHRSTRRDARPSRIEINCKGGRSLKVDASLDADMLKGLIRAVEEA